MSNSEKRRPNRPKTQTAPRSFAGRKRLSESEGDGLCVVCAHSIEIYAVGYCDHYICFKCSTKMRLLCNEKFCPVCRKELKKVIFSKKKDTFEHLNSLKLIKDKDYDINIFFADVSVTKEYKKLLEHKCPICPNRPADYDFDKLRAHLRKDHTLFYCEICLEHNRTFTSECKVYNRKDLATHKRIGDADDLSHKGHPLCHFCDERFLDNDKLFHHLRTTHYYCHICDQNEANEFYGSYEHLRVHFKKSHYLCEIGSCADEEFTSVFSSELDYKAHCASAHKDNKSKYQQKVERQIDLGFQYARRESPASRRKGYGEERPRFQQKKGKHSNFANAFERDSDLDQAISLSKKEATSSNKNKETLFEDNKTAATVEAAESSLFDHSTDFPDLAPTSKHEVFKPPVPEEKLLNSDKPKNNLVLWNKNPSNLSSRFQNDDDFPSLTSTQSSSSAFPPWGKSKLSKKKHSTKVQSTSALTSSKTLHHQKTNHQPNGNTSNSKQKFSKNMDDFPQLHPLNSVLVGCGSAKHFESYESYSSAPTSNVKLIAADTINGNHDSVNKTQDAHFVKDFPSSNISVPPGFNDFKPDAQFLELNNLSFQNFHDDFPSLVPSNAGQQIRAPPGFAPLPNQHCKTTHEKRKKNHNNCVSKDTGLINPKPLSETQQNSNKVIGYSSSSSQNATAGTTLSSFPISSTNGASNDLVSNYVSNSTNECTKKQEPFFVKDVEAEFPGLTVSYATPSCSFSSQIDQRQSMKCKKNNKPANKALNLGNVFDYPPL